MIPITFPIRAVQVALALAVVAITSYRKFIVVFLENAAGCYGMTNNLLSSLKSLFPLSLIRVNPSVWGNRSTYAPIL